MASSFFALFDDIASLLDDVATMTKVATKKTAGVLGDDLALNAQQVTGIQASRELPVVWAVAKGSLVNKAILVPTAIGISSFMPSLVQPLLMLGGAYLCFEGVEKVLHAKKGAQETDEHRQHLSLGKDELLRLEADKIKGAVRTDFILSAEIIVISLGTVVAQHLSKQIGVLVAISVIMTVGVYGVVAAIVKIDDLAAYLVKSSGGKQWKIHIGNALLWFAPRLLKALSIIGTLAMFLVGGGILVHGSTELHHFIETQPLVIQLGLEAMIGFAIGIICLALLKGLVYSRSLLAKAKK